LDLAGEFPSRLKARSTVNVNDRATKDEAIALASAYFNTYRAQIAGAIGVTDALLQHDKKWQDLVRLAHGNNQRKSYIRLLSLLTREIREFSVVSLVKVADAGGQNNGPSDLSPSEIALVSTIEILSPTAAASYRQGILDLRGVDRLSYRGTASEFREALRETLDYLAPDSEVVKQANFKPEDGQRQPTMKQKVRFILISRGRGKTQRASTEKAIEAIEELIGDVVRATYDRASLSTHLETSRTEVLRIKRYVDTVLFDLLEVPDVAASSDSTLPASHAWHAGVAAKRTPG
jgi:hypothetical protein